jgi:AcrR family transcriptional regulator
LILLVGLRGRQSQTAESASCARGSVASSGTTTLHGERCPSRAGLRRGTAARPVRRRTVARASRFFARKGYELVSLQEIGDAAGVSRGLPSYLFGSKQSLYEAVLARVITRAQETMARAYTEGDQAASPEDAVESFVGAFLDFLSSDRNFLRLMQREALGDGSRVTKFFGSAVDEVSLPSGQPRRRPGSRQSASSSTSPRSAGIRSHTSTRSCPRSG